MFHNSISRFLVFANIVAKLSNGQYFDADLNEQHDLFEGDIQLTEAQRRIINSGSGDITSYTALEGGNWPNGIIPYVIIDSSNTANKTDYINPENSFMFKDFTSLQFELIMEAMKQLHDSTCVRFVPRRMHHQYYIRIVNQLRWDKTKSRWINSGCNANQGRLLTMRNDGQRQRVNLASWCFTCKATGRPCTGM